MFPYLHIFGIEIAMYSICIGAGLVLAIILAAVRAKKRDLSREDVFNTSLFAIIGLIIGAKLLFFVTMIPTFIEYPQILTSFDAWVDMIRGGFVFYGGLIGVLAGIWIYTKMYKIPMMKMLDALIPSVPLAHAFGRIGCFCAGCCYGVPWEHGVEFNASEVAPHGVKLLPVQLIESGCNVALFALLLLLERRFTRKGMLTGAYLLGYAVIRFVLEYFRYDAERGSFWIFSTSQWISILLVPVAIWLIFFCGRKEKKAEEQIS